ncbi:ABC transporter ATP-binding protein [Homoserinibacter sp. GY 40078]|uniref:ABC transporter ATP-binding protein n=1 Tax=Homoserinibacter sp. GY 40078 TaxID=2603275 RepID=UPI0011C7BC56|nr:ABC transporter ATP-binding protein [Homoserinibacter sp. GY 40078]TXK19491.1 ABC transporter ATP-binding protein [Homoserinibacter sp. GY 40078]
MTDHAAIRLTGLTKEFGALTAVDHIDLEIAAGEFFSMLGPSGSGKTTVLRLIAGFEQPTSGTVELFGADVTRSAPFDREVNTVFQDYALFPHMSVIDNVAYGLRVRGVGRAERRDRAMRALAAVRLEQFASRKPAQLSGGQRQRVALARATVVEPKVLLLDEPLGALDLKLREQMQVELKQLQRELGITFIFVTHDQEEALTLSDRIAVFHDGRIEQLGTPRELYERPASRFVADFVGTTNLFGAEHARTVLGRDGEFSVRPEKLSLSASAPTAVGVRSAAGTLVETIYLGSAIRRVIDLDDGPRISVLQRNDRAREEDDLRGDRVHVSWHDEDIVALVPPGG